MIDIRKYMLLALGVAALPAMSETVLLNEDFNDDYGKSFPYMYDADQGMPNSAISSLFYSSVADVYMPWWLLRDSYTTQDKYMGSHSYYTNPYTSCDWLISIPLEIDTQGYVLTFDAQSVALRSYDKLSDLSLYITTEMLDITNIPDEPTKVWESIPYGVYLEECENDWIPYRYKLDDYVGQTIYINFVNENYDSDILCIDNVKVARQDVAEISLLNDSEYQAGETIDISAQLTVAPEKTLENWKVELTVDDKLVDSWSGEQLPENGVYDLDASLDLEIGQTAEYAYALTADNSYGFVCKGKVTRIAFEPTRRVWVEEATSTHCGNCPIGMYVFENMLEDPALADLVVPVSVHISALGSDPMVDSYYDGCFGQTSAPVAFINRVPNQEYFGSSDVPYDSSRAGSFANKVAQYAQQPTLIDLAVTGEWVIEGNDTIAIDCKATVKPAITLTDKDYRVAFILTENNVGTDNTALWLQSNYYSGMQVEDNLGGWTLLDDYVEHVRYHEVARSISSFLGHANSLPSTLEMEKEYTFEYRMAIPDVSKTTETGIVVIPAIQRQFCQLSAIVIDNDTEIVQNAARVPMSDVANERFTIADTVLGIEDVKVEQASGVEIYDLQGRRIENPAAGIYIKGGKKILIK